MAAAHRFMYREAIENIVYGPERVLNDYQNQLEVLTAGEVFVRYRFVPETILYLCGQLASLIDFGSRRNSPLPVLIQVLVFLRFCATGTFQVVIGDTIGHISQPTVSRTCRRVARSLTSLARRFITFPQREEARDVKKRFYDIAATKKITSEAVVDTARIHELWGITDLRGLQGLPPNEPGRIGFPNVVGCVDGCQIKIQRPSENEAEFVNRKGFHAINVEMICDAKFKVINLVAKWPGSTHDARVWRECGLCEEFENGIHNGFLLGDSGYPCKQYLMTPFTNPASRKEERFNSSLCRTRVLIEQTFGIIKRRFSLLHFGIRSSLENAVEYITSCVVLHNIGIDQGDIIDTVDVENDNPEPEGVFQGNTGNHIRQQIAERFF